MSEGFVRRRLDGAMETGTSGGGGDPKAAAPGAISAVPVPENRFTELFAEHYPRLVAFFGRRRRDPELSRDLAQETMLRVLGGLGRFRGEVPIQSWILRIATNVWRSWLRDHLRTQKRGAEERSLEDAYERREPPEAGALWPQPVGDPETRLAEAEERTRMYARLDQLSALQRRCLTMWLDGMSYQEIATAVGTSMQTVRPTLHKAKLRLRSLLAVDPALPGSPPEGHGQERR